VRGRPLHFHGLWAVSSALYRALEQQQDVLEAREGTEVVGVHGV
jgi:hypothetical protein